MGASSSAQQTGTRSNRRRGRLARSPRPTSKTGRGFQPRFATAEPAEAGPEPDRPGLSFRGAPGPGPVVEPPASTSVLADRHDQDRAGRSSGTQRLGIQAERPMSPGLISGTPVFGRASGTSVLVRHALRTRPRRRSAQGRPRVGVEKLPSGRHRSSRPASAPTAHHAPSFRTNHREFEGR